MDKVLRIQVRKVDHLWDAIERLAAYHELARATVIVLESKGQLAPPKKLRLGIEVEFCENILLNMFKITPAVFAAVTGKVRRNPQFGAELEKFCDAVVGKRRGKILITPSENEMMQLGTRNRDLLKKLKGGIR
jgi:hypothetical protein